MNERIETLAKAAGYDMINKAAMRALGFDVEKFAELIVAECAQACINMGNDYEIKSAGQYQAELFAFAIKQHFGVEE
jgi:hypothetical protein